MLPDVNEPVQCGLGGCIGTEARERDIGTQARDIENDARLLTNGLDVCTRYQVGAFDVDFL